MRYGTCLECGCTIEHAAVTGKVPVRCKPCQRERINARDRAQRAARPEVAPRPCEVCGAEFRPYRPLDARNDRAPVTTCSPRCYRQTARAKAVQREFYRRTKPRQRLAKLERQYGVDAEWLAAQGDTCAICGDHPAPGKSLHVDHDHETGAPRGLLCTRCNPGLGYFRDNPALLRMAAHYLTLSRQTQREARRV